jgi:hypothetical protein
VKEFAAVLQIVAWLASWGIDRFIAKWIAYFQIAWENHANDEAKAIFDATIHRVKINMPEKAKAWDDWRNKNASGGT